MVNSKGGIYLLKEEDDVNPKIASLMSKFEVMEIGKVNMNRGSEKDEIVCGICECNAHSTKDCSTILAFQEVLHEQANVLNGYKRAFSNQRGDTYNPNWWNHPNFTWRNWPNANDLQGPPPWIPYAAPQNVQYVPLIEKSLEDVVASFL